MSLSSQFVVNVIKLLQIGLLLRLIKLRVVYICILIIFVEEFLFYWLCFFESPLNKWTLFGALAFDRLTQVYIDSITNCAYIGT